MNRKLRTFGCLAGAIAISTIASQSWADPTVTDVAQEASTSGSSPIDVAPQPIQAVVQNTVEILAPAPGQIFNIPATSVVVRFPIGTSVELWVNGQPISAETVGRTETDSGAGVITQTWYGVTLQEGSNTLAVINAAGGGTLATTEVVATGAPVRLEVLSRQSSIPADGRTTATIEGQVLDAQGNTSNWDAVVTLAASAGDFIGNDFKPDQPGFQVQAQNGRFTAELQSTLTSDTVQLHAVAGTLEAFGQLQFVTPQRPSIATGVVDLRFGARGTNFYESFRDFLPLDQDNGYSADLDASLFAMGNLGEWLFTGAYNSDRPLNEDCRGETSLFRQSSGSCTQLYPIYGDDSTSDILTPSTDSLFLRFERTSPSPNAGTDFAMWGDFNTEEFATTSQLFTATSRQLHGFKLNYNWGDLAITGIYGNNIESFQRDIIAPDGTSGLYFLSNRLIVPGSEVIVIETEERDRPGTVIDREQLHRGTDYEIDYDRGTLRFEEPITRTAIGDIGGNAGTILVRRIVTTYQHENSDGNSNLWAARLQYNLSRTLQQESWLGASYLSESQGTRSFELLGADLQLSLGANSTLMAELAHSSSDFDMSGTISGSAYRLELESELSESFNGRAYFRSTDAGFTNAATTSFVPGQTRYGASANWLVGPSTTLRASVDRETNIGIAPRALTSVADLLEPGQNPVPGSRVDNALTTFSLGLTQALGDSVLAFDWLHRDRNDNLNPQILNTTSDQLRTRLTTPISDTLTIVAQNELNLSSQSDALYPDRTLFGLMWQFMPGLSLNLNQIFYGSGGLNNRRSVTAIDVVGEHQLRENTTIHGRFTTIEGEQVGGVIGLEQGFVLAPGLRLDLGYEHSFSDPLGTTAAGTQFIQPYAVGTGASSLTTTNGDTYSVGLAYTDNPDLQASLRLEHRDSSQGSNTALNASALGRLSPAVSVLFNYDLASSANQTIQDLGTSSTLKLGLAYRDPNQDNFNALLRYEHRLNPGSIPTNALFGTGLETAEHLFSAEAIYAPNWQWEFYSKYAFRNSTTRISRPADLGGDFNASNNLHLLQLRATYRFAYQWDITGEARWLGGIGGYGETGYALEAGYYATPDLRIYAGYSGGGANDDDFGVNRSASGFYVGVAAKINSLFNGFGLQNVAPAQQQESNVAQQE
jgi:hypothetical protein